MSLSQLRAHDALRPPPAPGLGRGFVLAVLAHALLVLALSAGVQWHTQPEPAFEAELWSAVPQAAAPRAAPPEEEEKPPEPDTQALQRQAQEQAQEQAQRQRDADIAIAKARKEKEREAEAREQALRDAERQKQERLKREAEALKLEKEKAEKDKAKEQAKEQARKLEADSKKADAKREALRLENLRRIQGMAGGVAGGAAGGAAGSNGNGPAGSKGAAARSGGPSPGYLGRVGAYIQRNIVDINSIAGNPVAEVEVQCAPDGTILSRKLVTPSSDGDWNRIVLRAIDKTEVLPRDTDGRAPCPFLITFHPKD